MTFVREPQLAPEQPAPDKDHVTPLFVGSLATVAVKFCVPPAVTFAAAGDSPTAIAPTIVTIAEDDFEPSATAVAVTVTVAGEGTEGGAV